MLRQAVFHKSDIPFAYPLNRDELHIVLKAASHDIKRAYVFYRDRYEWKSKFKVKQMYLSHSDELFDYFETTLKLKKKFAYYFYLVSRDGEKLYYTESGFFDVKPPANYYGYFQFPYICEKDIFFSPSWTNDCIIYQIFPERFFNGDKSNDPDNVAKWGEKPGVDTFFGGDLQGIIDKIDYLKALGINAIYLTPIFLSPTNHKYNTTDYYTIDPHFGDLETAKTLVKKCHENGIKVIFDAVFNHCGYEFFAFQDVVKNGRDSKYWDWFNIYDYPIKTGDECNYEVFSDHEWRMPKLMTKNPEVKKYLLDVAKYWLQEVDIDGWRLDVANEIDHSFWRDFRETVKSVKPDAIIIGEVMHDASPWLRGDQFDGVMNYPFKNALTEFFAKRSISASKFNTILTENLMRHMRKVNECMLNLIGSHDTERFLTMADENISRMKLAIVFQFTYPGIPYIYYGDEVGMTGGFDPDCRRCMIWDENNQNKDIYNFYKKLISIRKNSEELRYGDIKTLYAKDSVIAFERRYGHKITTIVINNSDRSLKVPSQYFKNKEEILDMSSYQLDDKYAILEPNSAYILK